MTRSNQDDADELWRSDFSKCGKGQLWLQRREGTRTDVSSSDGSLNRSSHQLNCSYLF